MQERDEIYRKMLDCLSRGERMLLAEALDDDIAEFLATVDQRVFEDEMEQETADAEEEIEHGEA